jgi:hypothetical protein
MAFTPEQQREQVAAWERSLHGDDEASRHLRCVDCGRFAQVHDWPYCGFHASKRAILAFFERDDSQDDDDDDDDKISGGHPVRPSFRLQLGSV